MGVNPRIFVLAMSATIALHAADVTPSVDWSARFSVAQAALKEHNYSRAASLLAEAVTQSETPDQRAQALSSYGIALHCAGRNAEAKPALEEALAQPANVPVQDRELTLDVLALVYRGLGDYAGAERVLRAAMAGSPGTPLPPGDVARLMVNLADLLREEARESEASVVLNDAGKLEGLTWQQQASILVETAGLDRDMNLFDSSIALWNKLGEINSRQHSSELEVVIDAGLGETWFAIGNVARAEPLLRRSVALLREDAGASTLQLVRSIAILARIYTEEDKLALAEEALDEAITKDEDSLGQTHPQVATLLELKATVLSRRGEAQAARDTLEDARVIMSKHFGPESNAVAGVYAELGDVEQRAHQPAAAIVQYNRAMQLLRKNGEGDARFGPELVARYAAALKAAHKPDEARTLLESLSASATSTQSFRQK